MTIFQKNKSGNNCIAFAPDNYPVHEIWINNGNGWSVVPVSTPCLTVNGLWYFSYAGNLANYYSLPVSKGCEVKVRTLLVESYWAEYPNITSWQKYKDDADKFSQFSNSIILK